MNETDSKERRTALANFLTQRRKQVRRQVVDLPPGPRGRTVGLSREEVAYHAAVSMTWYTWLEQAREIQPSREVMLAIADALHLDDQERIYILQLAGYSSPARERHLGTGEAPDSVQQLMDAISPNPAYAIFTDWFVVGWNSAYEAMFPRIAEVPAVERNLLSLVFTEESVRRLMPDWETDSHHFLAQFRAEAGPYLAHPEVSRLVDHLMEVSEEFRTGWRAKD
ncbi:MAG: helix-turn-helix transcriptional regulator, partial [Candidatus Rokuibacteriota bacterium]